MGSSKQNVGKKKKQSPVFLLSEKAPARKKAGGISIRLVTVGKKKKKFTFPSLPEKITCKSAAKYQSFDILSQGTVKVPKGTDVKEISWEGEFFGKAKKNEAIVKKSAWKKPSDCVKTLENYMKKGTVLNLIVTGTWINLDVTVSSFQTVAYGACSVKAKKTKKKTKPRNEAEQVKETADTSYVVKSGDTLWKIAKAHYGSGTQWTRIYDVNAGTIEAAARQHGKAGSDHGHWIYPGTALTIPA